MNSWLLEVWRVWTLWGSRLTFVIRDIQNNASTKQLKMMLQYKLFSTPTKFKTMCYSSILHKSPGLLCTCLCAYSDRSSLWALFQSCFSLSIFPGARINKHRWVKGKKKTSVLHSTPLFMNGQIISKFQSVYHYHTGKTFLFWAALYFLLFLLL